MRRLARLLARAILVSPLAVVADRGVTCGHDRRAARVLDVAAAHGCRLLVPGAWGCDVFGNDPAEVAATFGAGLAERADWFDHVVFAVLDRDEHSPTRAAFVGLATAD